MGYFIAFVLFAWGLAELAGEVDIIGGCWTFALIPMIAGICVASATCSLR